MKSKLSFIISTAEVEKQIFHTTNMKGPKQVKIKHKINNVIFLKQGYTIYILYDIYMYVYIYNLIHYL